MPRDGIERTFGQIVREERLARGFTQEALAERAGLHATYISLLERGQRNPSLSVIAKVAAALELSMAQLVGKLEARRGRG